MQIKWLFTPIAAVSECTCVCAREKTRYTFVSALRVETPTQLQLSKHKTCLCFLDRKKITMNVRPQS